MSEANFNVNLPSSESDDDMSSTGITEKELVAIENEVMPETTKRGTKYGMNKTVDWFTDKKIDLACNVHVNKIDILTCYKYSNYLLFCQRISSVYSNSVLGQVTLQN